MVVSGAAACYIQASDSSTIIFPNLFYCKLGFRTAINSHVWQETDGWSLPSQANPSKILQPRCF